MRALRSSRAAKFIAVTAAALGLAAGAAGSANAAGHKLFWMDGKEMPQASAFHWQAHPEKRYGGAVGNGDFQWLVTCGPTGPLHALHATSFGVESFTTKTRGVQGTQILLGFPTAAKAKAAMNTLERDYTTCAPRLDRMFDFATKKRVHAGVERTAWIQDGISYRVEIRNVLGRPAEVADLPSDAQEFFVRRGNEISIVQIEGTNAHVDVAKGSLNVLKTMAARLG